MIQGQLLRITPHHEAAIYLRDGVLWVADFVDGRGKLVDAAVWFRFNCPALPASHAARRMVRESAIPLNPSLIARIEELHASGMAGKRAQDIDSRDPSHCATARGSSHRGKRDVAAKSRFAETMNRPEVRKASHAAIVKASSIALAASLLIVAIVWL